MFYCLMRCYQLVVFCTLFACNVQSKSPTVSLILFFIIWLIVISTTVIMHHIQIASMIWLLELIESNCFFSCMAYTWCPIKWKVFSIWTPNVQRFNLKVTYVIWINRTVLKNVEKKTKENTVWMRSVWGDHTCFVSIIYYQRSIYFLILPFELISIIFSTIIINMIS